MTTAQDPIAHAARLLRETAEELRQAHAYHRSEGWQGETGAQSAYDVYMAAAQALEDWEQAIGAGGVQALSAAPAAKKSALRTYPNPIVPLIKPVSEQEKMRALYLASSNLMAYLGRNGAIHSDGHAADAMMDCLNDLDGGGFDETLFAASPTPPAEQAAPKAAPGVGNSGFDHQTAADFLNGKTVSDEAVRKFVAASRWAHDERAALSATLLAMHGVLTSREAEIALLKKALMEAEAAPRQEAQEPAPSAAVFGLRLVPVEPTDQMVQAAHHIDLSYMPGQEGADRAAIYRAMIAAAPQPAPAPVSEPIDQLERALAIIGVVGAIDGHDVVRRESVLEIARRAALAAQGGK